MVTTRVVFGGLALTVAVIFIPLVFYWKAPTNESIDKNQLEQQNVVLTKTTNFRRSIADADVPQCTNSTFCEETPHYPSGFVNISLSMNESLKLLATVDVVPVVVGIRIDDGSESLCRSKEVLMKPKSGLSMNNKWLFIVNDVNFKQTVRVELCENPGETCSIIDGFALGYKTFCRQTYIFRQMLAIGTSWKMKPVFFKVPASCKCFIRLRGRWAAVLNDKDDQNSIHGSYDSGHKLNKVQETLMKHTYKHKNAIEDISHDLEIGERASNVMNHGTGDDYNTVPLTTNMNYRKGSVSQAPAHKSRVSASNLTDRMKSVIENDSIYFSEP